MGIIMLNGVKYGAVEEAAQETNMRGSRLFYMTGSFHLDRLVLIYILI